MKVRSAQQARESGFYWVMSGREWVVAEWEANRSKWTLTGYWDSMNDNDFEEIDERRIERTIA